MRTVVALAFVLLAFTACELPQMTPPEKTDMVASKQLLALDVKLLWEVVKREVEAAGYYLDQEASNPMTGEFETHWINQLAPFRYEGREKKLVGLIEQTPDRPEAFQVLIITWVQRNADLDDPLNPRKAIWQNTDSDIGTTGQILYRIERSFRAVEE